MAEWTNIVLDVSVRRRSPTVYFLLFFAGGLWVPLSFFISLN